MENNNSRNYSCKDIEFIVICGFTAFSFKRDLLSFTKYSPKFNDEYAKSLDAEIATAKDLVEPQSELVAQKAITDHMHTTMRNLLEPLDWLKGYIQLAGTGISISVKDFGIPVVREATNKLDIEGVLKGMHTVNTNVVKFKTILTAQGLTDEFQTRLQTDADSIANDKQKQFEIQTNRKAILQDNVGFLNALNTKITEIHAVGKILFRGSDLVKLQEYTFTELLKKVRRTSKPDSDKPDTTKENDNTPVSK